MKNIDIKITLETLELADCQAFIEADNLGGLVHFVGTVRNQTKGKKVLYLDFEGYEPMAIKEMQKIAEEAMQKFKVEKIAIYHRLGKLAIGEIPVIIGVASAHRDAAFAACQYAIDTLKQTVPIWKKEYFKDGEVWVSATP